MHKVNLDPVVEISPSGQGISCGARTRDRRAPVFLRQVRISPSLAIELVTTISDVGATIITNTINTSSDIATTITTTIDIATNVTTTTDIATTITINTTTPTITTTSPPKQESIGSDSPPGTKSSLERHRTELQSFAMATPEIYVSSKMWLLASSSSSPPPPLPPYHNHATTIPPPPPPPPPMPPPPRPLPSTVYSHHNQQSFC
ncbi:hypothetical protein PoB_005751200 [Plakobranchus ocellatus]|uniref:Uncharacterized protein n=1 Tax=Plakobranchus ocellatus TaxID=259542 RepID=A0AAV4CI63_9GAST|nr:hypothetical protein PoB_005751200 [Plakobranchus ocellatus]